MKKKRFIIPAITLGVLALLIIIIWPAAQLWKRLGAETFCIQGSFPEIKFVSCDTAEASLEPIARHSLPTPGGENPIPLIFDDDGSPDGMIALLYFLSNPLFEVKAVTISCGEAHPEIFARHVQRMLAGFGKGHIPVGAGREVPLEGINEFPKPWRDLSDDFWGIPLPDMPTDGDLIPAAELIVDILNHSNQPVMVFLSGNHTNLAEALQLDPGITSYVREVQIMGGSIHVPGNIHSDWEENDNEVAEWNIWIDPVAAKKVFTSGLPLRLVPLDATNQVTWARSDAKVWTASGSPEGELAGKILEFMLDSWSVESAYIWDLVAAVNATYPDLCPEKSLAVDILTEIGPNQGQTNIRESIPNAITCLYPDVQAFKDLTTIVFGK